MTTDKEIPKDVKKLLNLLDKCSSVRFATYQPYHNILMRRLAQYVLKDYLEEELEDDD